MYREFIMKEAFLKNLKKKFQHSPIYMIVPSIYSETYIVHGPRLGNLSCNAIVLCPRPWLFRC